MFGVFAKGKAARLGLAIRNIFSRKQDERISVAPRLRVSTDEPLRRSLAVKVVPFKNDKRMPVGTRMFFCRQGFFMKKHGYTAFSGPCPTLQAAQRTALRNLGY